jgi:twitching motility protein PilT
LPAPWAGTYVPAGPISLTGGGEATISEKADEPMTIDDLLRFMVQQEASDLHLKPMRPPLLRMKGKLLPLKTDPLHPDLLREMLNALLNDRMRQQLEDNFAIDFGHSVPGVSRFRASVFMQRGTLSAVFRRVPFEFPSLEDWGLPEILGEFTKLSQGLVLITGPTGLGKSSTLAAMMRMILNSQLVHVVTIEDPIEFLLKDNLGAATQREVGMDTPGLLGGAPKRAAPGSDVIMVGEIPRPADDPNGIDRRRDRPPGLLDRAYQRSRADDRQDHRPVPEGNHRQIRQQLASVIQGIVSLKLVERADGTGLVAAVEILRHSPRVAKLILDGSLETLEEELESSVSYYKMQSMNQSLASLVLRGAVKRDTAINISTRPGDLDLMLRKYLYASEAAAAAEHGEPMADSLSDFSKILELQEIKKLYDELQERHRQDIRERDEEIERLKAKERRHDAAAVAAESDGLRAEIERLNKQAQLLRQEYEAKIERLNARIRESSARTRRGLRLAAPEAGEGVLPALGRSPAPRTDGCDACLKTIMLAVIGLEQMVNLSEGPHAPQKLSAVGQNDDQRHTILRARLKILVLDTPAFGVPIALSFTRFPAARCLATVDGKFPRRSRRGPRFDDGHVSAIDSPRSVDPGSIRVPCETGPLPLAY